MTQRRDIMSLVAALAARLGAVGAPRTASGPVAAALPPQRAPLPLGNATVVGTRYHAAPRVAATLREGQALLLRREPFNPHDPWAVAIHSPAGDRLGYLPRGENRGIAHMLDAGGRIEAEILEGHPYEVTPGNWRIEARLALVDAGPATTDIGDGAAPPVNLLRSQPLMAERHSGPDTGGRAVMLAGPCAGWQRTKAVEWVPPGALPLPAWEVVARDYRLVGGEAARIQTRHAMATAERLGIAVPGSAIPSPPPSPEALARPEERPKPLLRGWLPVLGTSPEAVRDALRYLKLRPARDDPRGAHTVLVLNRHGWVVGALPRPVAEIVSRLIGEGYQVDMFARDPGPQATAGGQVSVPYELCLRGDDPPDIARNRARRLLDLAEVVPEAWDVGRQFGRSSLDLMGRFLERAVPATSRAARRLTVAEAEAILAWATPEAERGPARVEVLGPRRPARLPPEDVDLLSPRRRGRGMPLPQRMRMVAVRLEAGLRETPQRFMPVAAHVAGLGLHAKRRFVLWLIEETLAEAAEDAGCPEDVRQLLAEACEVSRPNCRDRSARRQALREAVSLAAPRLRRRRSIHCHGAITRDRRLLFLRTIVAEREAQVFAFETLCWTIAYAMADYHRDHFVMRGAGVGRRVRRLADWVEAEMARAAGLAVAAGGDASASSVRGWGVV